MEKTKLEMEFLDNLGKKFVLSIDNPRADLSPQEVKTAMEGILAHNVFQSQAGDLSLINDARVVTTRVDKLEI